jgi:DNA-binding beta-propeller fold protein YncE
MKTKLKKCITVLSAFAALASVSIPPAAAAGVPSESYNYDQWGEAVPSQAGYTADRAVSGYDLGIGAFDEPSDIFIGRDETVYIVDTGNDRIVTADPELKNVIRIYDSFTMPDGTETRLRKPMGVFVSAESGDMYIADTENSRILVSDTAGNIKMEILKPESEVYDSKRTFMPQRVVADKAGNIYTVLGNITTGAAMFSPDGEFTGFYGANRVDATAKVAWDHFRGMFMSDEKKALRKRTVPSGITSFDIDGDFIFTCTSSSTQSTDTVKKLNAAGRNIFADRTLFFGDYHPIYDSTQNKMYSTSIVDIDIAEDGCINCLDFTTGRVFQYDEECNLLFITGATAKQTGGFDHAAAVESLDDKLYVLDSFKDTVTIFRETSFGEEVHRASALYNDGYYEEALGPWEEVLARDGNYLMAYIGVASALLRKGDYKGAMKYAKLADSEYIYNKAFEGWRREFLREHFTALAAAAVLLTAALVALGKYRRKRRASADTEKKEERQQ